MFAQSVAGNVPASEAYRSAGYAGSMGTARANGARLLANDSVRARVNHLRELATRSRAVDNWLTKKWVLNNMRKVFELAVKKGKLGDAISSLRLLGLEAETGLFRERREHQFVWDGDLTKLTEGQLRSVLTSLDRMLGDEPEEAAAELGPVVDVTGEKV